jgi:uncharacterized protein with GYD domain
MPKYLLAANYVGDGIQGLVKDGGSARRTAAAKAFESVGGRLEAFYFAFGEADAYVIGEVPDNVSMAALAIAINATDAVAIRTTVLLTPEDVDAAVKKTPKYRPPGGKKGGGGK